MNAIIASAIAGIILMFSGVTIKNRQTVTGLATVLFFILLGVNFASLLSASPTPDIFYNDMLVFDRFSYMFNFLMTGATFLYILLLKKDISRVGTHVGEYFALISFIMLGIYLLAGYNNLLMLFLGIEIISIPQYVLAGSDKRNLKSSEASLKYLLMGAFSTGLLLMGITLIYGSTASFDINGFKTLFSNDLNPLALAGIILLIIAFAFKVSAVPMHLWTPDVYDGAPTPFTAFMATIVKSGAFLGFLRLFHISFGNLSEHWVMVLAIVTAATLLVGNITAVFQQSVKRMLAYSSIAQAGFMLFAVMSVNKTSWNAITLYAVAYSLATIGIFAVLAKMKDYTYDGFNGLARKDPALALCVTIFLLSLTGIPLTAGFMAKYYVLMATIQQGHLFWLVIFALLMAAVSASYYFRVIIAMYFKSGEPGMAYPITAYDRFMLGLTAVLVILIGIFPQWFF
jgi:NADH-quinone oxidoreductase subunit N